MVAELGTAAWTGCLRFPSSTAIPWMELITQGEPSDPDWSALTVGSPSVRQGFALINGLVT